MPAILAGRWSYHAPVHYKHTHYHILYAYSILAAHNKTLSSLTAGFLCTSRPFYLVSTCKLQHHNIQSFPPAGNQVPTASRLQCHVLPALYCTVLYCTVMHGQIFKELIFKVEGKKNKVSYNTL